MATVLIIYYKQISEGYEDHDRFRIMQQVGMSQKEVKRTISKQVLTVFFAPLIAVLRDYDARFSAAKHERKVLDFSDLEHLTVRLLTERHEEGYVRTPLCRKLQSEFDELCIDEYQDVNRLQDLIFALVARNDNRFMVGDVKQSIYRFRNAEPEIFESYRNDYDGGNTGETVFLRENFRCNRCITEFVNAVLTPVYTKENTGSDYARAQ